MVTLHRLSDGAELVVNFDLVVAFHAEGTGTRLLFAPVYTADQVVSEPLAVALDLAEK